MNKEILVVSETFYSVQGEGATCGVPAVFLRLAGCNLRCNGFSYKDPNTSKHLGCDSKLVWMQGDKCDFSRIIAQWQSKGYMMQLERGAHLVITGGEPLLQQFSLIRFIDYLDHVFNEKIYIEVETNATVMPDELLFRRVNQWNISPKLSFSGEVQPPAEIIKYFSQYKNTHFKFVIATPEDVDEVVAVYHQSLGIDNMRIWLMPEGGTRERINTIKPWLVERAKLHCMNFTSRLQVDLWDEVTGV